ncbi:anaphase-promoting complex subunit 10 [Russula aff. rugulosa BPL654]|nr:anaphase-promoting complex subunit 10 [Russula aff. rugulosa BPL654]
MSSAVQYNAQPTDIPTATPRAFSSFTIVLRRPPVLPWPDIGHLAKWSVSSFKFGFGPECLQDQDPETFWHSDGPQPHFITVEFPRKMAIQLQTRRFLHAAALSVRAGTSPGDLQEVRAVTLDRPDGWITFDVSSEPGDDGEGFKPIHAYILQVIVLANHMNGKDTHVRGMRILGPIEDQASWDDPFPFVDPKFKMYEHIR